METVVFVPKVWAAVHGYLEHGAERMAFLAAVPASPAPATDAPREDGSSADGRWVVVDVMYLDDETDYVRQDWHGMELADDIRPRSLKWATGHDAALIEVHSHGPGAGRTTFSNHDLRGLREGAPSLAWRLRGRPYGALVVGGRHHFDGLVWDGPKSPPRPLPRVAVGAQTLQASGRALSRLAHLDDDQQHDPQHDPQD
jgi:hypothetical protein